jgi:hypothetical protein
MDKGIRIWDGETKKFETIKGRLLSVSADYPGSTKVRSLSLVPVCFLYVCLISVSFQIAFAYGLSSNSGCRLCL